MKSFLRHTVVFFVTILARAVVRKYRPRIVVVTGSVGKTSTKDAVAAVLATKCYVRKSEKSYNSDTGVPLTILGCKNPWNNYGGWFGVIREGCALLFLPNLYPEVLVLEVGADKPGDIRSLMQWIQPSFVVLTTFPEIPVHVEAYASPAAVREEEFIPARMLLPQGTLITNADDLHGAALAKTVSEQQITYGITEPSDVQATEIAFMYDENGDPVGMRMQVTARGVSSEVCVPGVLGVQHVYPTLAAIATGVVFDVSLQDAARVLNSNVHAPGRMRIIEGVKNTVIIDDTYNASPIATEEALGVLSALGATRRKVVVLGDMLELGIYSVAEHKVIGTRIPRHADLLVAVGIRTQAVVSAARESGMEEEKILSFYKSKVAAEHLCALLQERDIVLVKGSQSMRIERIVEAIMRDKERAEELLARQEREWKERE
jgi:UDP-N-acetylmuramyl pentapeptide synthase